MRTTTLTVGPLVAASANNIALSQTPAPAFTLSGSTAGILDTPRRILFTQAASESGKTYTIVGTGYNGPQTEVLAAAASATTVQSNLDFKTVTSITMSANASGAITVGTNGVASSRWMFLDAFAPGQVTGQVVVSGTVNYTVEQTMQDPDSPTNVVMPYSMTWQPSNDPNVVGSTTSWATNFAYAPTYTRVTLNSGAGSISAVFTQNSSSPY